MTTHDDVKAFLEHHGVKGMRWGQRNRSQKAELVGASAASFIIGHNVSRFMAKRFGLSPSMQVVLTGAATVVGTNATRAYLNRYGQVPYSQLSRENES